jgi:hypothetical protein
MSIISINFCASEDLYCANGFWSLAVFILVSGLCEGLHGSSPIQDWLNCFWSLAEKWPLHRKDSIRPCMPGLSFSAGQVTKLKESIFLIAARGLLGIQASNLRVKTWSEKNPSVDKQLKHGQGIIVTVRKLRGPGIFCHCHEGGTRACWNRQERQS